MARRNRTTGIINEGSDNTFVNVSTEGFDVGIHDKKGQASNYVI